MVDIKFSVLMSLYNAEKTDYFEESLISLNSQKFKATEVVLVLDGPINSALLEVIERWKDILNIVTVPLKCNVGLSKALNIGLNYCQYELVARMDTDDVCIQERFLSQMNFLNENEDIDIVGSYCFDISESGSVIKIRKVPTSHERILESIWACPLIHPSVAFRKSKINKIGGYSETVPRRQDDYELWIRAATKGLRFANIPEVLLRYRVPENAFQKNTVRVGLNRVKIGFKAVCKFDPKLSSFLGLIYPLIRSLLPYYFQGKLSKLMTKFDPRNKN